MEIGGDERRIEDTLWAGLGFGTRISENHGNSLGVSVDGGFEGSLSIQTWDSHDKFWGFRWIKPKIFLGLTERPGMVSAHHGVDLGIGFETSAAAALLSGGPYVSLIHGFGLGYAEFGLSGGFTIGVDDIFRMSAEGGVVLNETGAHPSIKITIGVNRPIGERVYRVKVKPQITNHRPKLGPNKQCSCGQKH